MRGKWLLFGAIVILAAIAAGALSVLRRERKRPPAPPPASAQPFQNKEEASLTGTLRARNVVNVEAGVDGIVESFSAGVGDEVHEGDLLAHIASQMLESEQQKAAAQVETTARASRPWKPRRRRRAWNLHAPARTPPARAAKPTAPRGYTSDSKC